jgi:gamma-glutamylcysteine synthetase
LFLEGSLSTATYNSWFSTHATRSNTALKALLVNADNFSGAINGTSYSYIVRKMSPYKYGFEPKDFTSKSDLNNYLKYAARAIAYAHSRSDKDYSSTYINYNFENSALNAVSAWPSTKSTIRDIAAANAKVKSTRVPIA